MLCQKQKPLCGGNLKTSHHRKKEGWWAYCCWDLSGRSWCEFALFQEEEQQQWFACAAGAFHAASCIRLLYLQEDCGSCKAKRAYNKTGNYRAEAAADTSDEDWMHLPCVKKVSNRCLQTTWKYCLLHWQCTQSIGPRSCNNISSLAHLCLLELFLSSVNCVLCLAY